jgi:hypothetical protein
MARLVSNLSTKEFLMTYRGMMVTGFLLVSFLTLPAIAAEGDTLKVASIFGDHMVVQAGKPIPVWVGWRTLA